MFIGPTPSAMRKLGDKISSTIVAQSANVPTISWSGDGVTLDSVDPLSVQTAGTACEIPVAVYRRACVESVTEGEHVSRRIGYPVMIKASEGGGGKGIRKVNDESEFKQAFEQCMREVPGSPIFIMKCIGNCRHLEVQILGDLSGNIISIFGRDCSVQRRHQKIIEEAPITIAPQSIIEKMESSAVRLAKLVGYTGAGTVEYLYDPETMEFFFLELNPRLQVEHPCTEMVSGVNLPAAQLQIAMGIPLNRMKEVQKFTTDSNISVRPKCHVIATRITAENPNRGFKPNLGSMQELNFRSSKHVWGYFSVGASGGLHEFADSQFGHLFAYGESRDQARRNMIVALKELSIRGDFQTTIEYLVMLLETESFKANKISTAWLDDIILDNRLTVERPNLFVAVFCFAVAKAAIRFAALRNEYINGLEKGHVPSKELMSIRHKNEIIYEGVKYKTETFQIGQEMFGVKINSETAVTVHCRSQSDSGFLMSLDSKSFVVYLKDDVDGCRMSLDGKTCIFESENDPTILKTPSSGKLVRFMVDDGAIVKMGQYYAEIEVSLFGMRCNIYFIGNENVPSADMQFTRNLAPFET